MSGQHTPAELRAHARVLLDEADEIETPVTETDLKKMTPEQIVKACEQGRLSHLLGSQS